MSGEVADQDAQMLGREPGRAATQEELRRWVEEIIGGPVTQWQQIAGGNRCLSWAVDVMQPPGRVREVYLRYQPPRPPSAEPYTVWREARFYEALKGSDVPAPRLIAVHPECQAMLTERVPGRADFRRIPDEAARESIVRDFVQALARLHRLPIEHAGLPGLDPGASIADCVRTEIATWRAMYEESGRSDPLIDLALDWLAARVPDPDEPPVLVHGDAGPGNFLFENGHMTALLDWELAHPGDPMEDLAWFSMRSVMEPVPDFAARIREYSEAAGRPVDHARIRYHRVFVSTRVVIIRHRNVTGQPGNSIVSRALNRRLLVDALAEANGIAIAPPAPIEAGPTALTGYYDAVLHDLRHEIAAVSEQATVVAAAKNSAKVLKFLREADRLGPTVARLELEALSALLGRRVGDAEAGKADALAAMRAGGLSFEDLIRFYAGSVAREAALAASASGGLAQRRFPELMTRQMQHA